MSSQASFTLEASDSEANVKNDTASKEKKGLFAILNRDQSVKPKELYQFLPAAIEVERTPASPAGRAIIWAIVILFTIACVWAYFGKIDIVAVAQGKVIPSEHIKHIQAFESGKISSIYVEEGQYVNRGDVLVTLDSTQTKADFDRLSHEVNDLLSNIKRLQSFDAWLGILGNELASMTSSKNYDTNLVENSNALPFNQQRFLEQQKRDVSTKLSSLTIEKQRIEAEALMVEAEITKRQRVIPVLSERVSALEQLYKKEYGSKLPYLELKQELIEEEQDLKVQQARQLQLNTSILSIEKEIQSLIAEKQLATLGEKQELATRLESLKQETVKAEQRYQFQEIKAPISGQVQQLAIHTIGGVVTTAQVLMVIVPEQSRMEVDVQILNKDIGFVSEGQLAEVKVDTFNFTKYGLIEAQIESISDDAIQDENLGLVYNARLLLDREHLVVEGKQVRLSPGMSVTAEVKTGKRRLIEYFLSPLLRYKQESLGER